MSEILTDGIVIDYTKSSTPYKDDRFSEPLKIADTVSQPPVERTTRSVASRIELEESCDLGDNDPAISDDTVDTRTARTDEEAETQKAVEKLHKERGMELLSGQPIAKPKTTQPSSPSLLELVAKIHARKDTLESLDFKTAEIATAIKTLDWVLSITNVGER